MVTSAKPSPEVEGKALSDYWTHNSELVQSFHGLRRTFPISSFLVLGEGRKKARPHQTRHKAKAMFSLDFRSKEHFKVHWWLLLCDLFWIFPQISTTRSFLNLECYTNSIQKLLGNLQFQKRSQRNRNTPKQKASQHPYNSLSSGNV